MMAVFKAEIEKRGVPDCFDLTGVGRSMTGLVRDAFLEPQARVVGRLTPPSTPEDIIAAFEQQGWGVRSLVVFADGTGDDLIHERARRHHQPIPPLRDDFD